MIKVDDIKKLEIKVIKDVEPLDSIDLFLYGMISAFLTDLFLPGSTLIGILILFGVTNFIVAPFFADLIVKYRVNRYIERNYEKMVQLGKGELDFLLYTVQYKLSWTYV